jgi:membrane protease YdiL (CAAX protease family)
LWLLVQTTPHYLLRRRPVGPRFVRFAALFYGFLTVAAVLWSGLGGLEPRLFADSVALSTLLGALTAVATVSMGLLAYRLLPVLREIAEELAPRLVDGADRGNLVLVSVFSGVGEETFFRGAVQQEFGLVVASLVFGLVHVGPDRRYLVWTAWAVLVGFLYGALYEVTGGLLAPILAHSAHNAATLLLWRRSRKGLGEAGGV